MIMMILQAKSCMNTILLKIFSEHVYSIQAKLRNTFLKILPKFTH